MTLVRIAVFGLVAASAMGCPNKPTEPEPKRCEFDVMAHPELFSLEGKGARATRIVSAKDTIGGQFAASRVGDYLLENDKIRVAVDQPGRTLVHVPFGGNIVDADLKRPEGEAGRDGLGNLGLLYSFGRAVETKRVEVLRDGSQGGPAVVAATGVDQGNDLISIQANIDKQVSGIKLLIDPEKPQNLRTTTYYVLSPGQERVRIVSALCNDGDSQVTTTFADVSSGGGTMDFFNPSQCKGTWGQSDCIIDPLPWLGWNGDGVAYGYRSYKPNEPSQPDTNAALYLSGTVASIASMKDLSGVLSWVDAQNRNQPGRIVIPSKKSHLFVRDLVVAPTLSDVDAVWLTLDGAAKGTATVTVKDNGAPVANARVIAEQNDGSLTRLRSLATTDAQGKATLTLAPGSYRLTAALLGRSLSPPQSVNVLDSSNVAVDLTLAPTRVLTVHAKDVGGAALPAKVVVRCNASACAKPPSAFARFAEVEEQADNVAALAYVPPSGTTTVALYPGAYEVTVTHGPEFSMWPDTAPAVGQVVDLSTADQTVTAVLARVVDTTGWVSADLHVHAVNSADSSAPHEGRVLAFVAEGVDVLVATDHDFITDYRPVIEALGAKAHVASVIGDELSPNFGHHNAFPLNRNETANGGAVDWAGGSAAPTLRPGDFYALTRSLFPGAFVQVNHPRSKNGIFETFQLDTLTGATHMDPTTERIAVPADSTPADTKLFSSAFDGLEVQNGVSPQTAALNDWMLFLSRGLVRTATSVSDTHSVFSSPAGYGRTYVKTGTDTALAFDEGRFIAGLKSQTAVGTNGPFLSVTAQKLDGADAPTGTAVDVGETLSVSSGQKVRITVTVQAPEWMQFDRMELYTHAAGREAWDGKSNTTWPVALATKTFDPTALPLEVVPNTGAATFRRVKVVHTFDVSPTVDSWYVVSVRGTSASKDLFPLVFKSNCGTSTCTATSAKAFAFSNAILVDADGSGAYDTFALTQGLRSRP